MNLELLARLNQDHLQELHRDARRDSLARAALRLPRNSRPSFASWARFFEAPTENSCCQAAA